MKTDKKKVGKPRGTNNPNGRPKKTLDSLPKGWEKKIIAIGKRGDSEVAMRRYLKISNDLWYRLLKEYPLFSEIIRTAREECMIWWENLGKKCALGDVVANPTFFVFQMKNRFPDSYKDRRENVTHLSLSEELSNLADKLPD